MQSEASSSGYERKKAYREAHAVKCLRLLVALLLVVAAAVVTSLSFHYVKQNQSDAFEHAYEESVNRLLSVVQIRKDSMVAATSSSSVVFMTHYGHGAYRYNASAPANRGWPFVAMPNFEQQVIGLMEVSNGRAFEFSPIIKDADRFAWEEYVLSNANTVNASEQQLAKGIYMKDEDNKDISATGNYPGARYQGLFSPVWQIAPVSTNSKAFLFDLRSQADRRRAVDDMITFKVPTLTSVLQLVQDAELRPSAILFSPVFSYLGRTEVVGSTLVVFNWDKLFEKILPNNIKGLVIVMSTNTGQSFTYAINGGNVLLLGKGDLHSSKYDKHRVTFQTSLGDNDALNVPDEYDSVVRYTLHVYPSAAFESQHMTNAPAVYAAVIASVFVVTSAAFLLYDFIGRNHRNFLVHAATKANLIVDSMFPDTVRDRLFLSHRDVNQPVSAGETRNRRAFHGKKTSIYEQVSKPAQTMKRFLLPGATKGEEMDELNASHIDQSSPIADLFPEATVGFADIAGFTSWSSERDPEDVFLLLEKLFRAFDHLASEQKVFKISTIGDCYLSVVGLPDAREDHAEAMAVFASECQKEFDVIVKDLSRSLGPETAELSLRVGLHSGPVTAGVLRGLKPRFEVFGDTVNTASRMESTGQPKRVQLSEQTAKLLIDAGKESWLETREGTILAKGKGHMQTYWLNTEAASSGSHYGDQVLAVSSNEEFPRTGESADPLHGSVETIGTQITGGSCARNDMPKEVPANVP